jgi:hypothetical protein
MEVDSGLHPDFSYVRKDWTANSIVIRTVHIIMYFIITKYLRQFHRAAIFENLTSHNWNIYFYFLWNSMFNYNTQISASLNPISSHINLVHMLPFTFKINFNILTPPSTHCFIQWSFSSRCTLRLVWVPSCFPCMLHVQPFVSLFIKSVIYLV